MKFSRTRFAIAFFIALCCTGAATSQDHSSQPTALPVSGYNYMRIDYPNASSTSASAINNKGEIVGYYVGAGCAQYSCAFTDVKGAFANMECSGGYFTNNSDINNKGEIVGTYSDERGEEGYTWSANGSCDTIIEPNGILTTRVMGVNDSGDLVGFYEAAPDDNFQGFLEVDGEYTTISCSGFASTQANGINDAGLIVGNNGTYGAASGFIYKGGKCISFSYPGAVSTVAISVNKGNQISGYYQDTSGAIHGFVKTGNSFVAINYPGATSTWAFYMNDVGQVSGQFRDAHGMYHGFVAIPKK